MLFVGGEPTKDKVLVAGGCLVSRNIEILVTCVPEISVTGPRDHP